MQGNRTNNYESESMSCSQNKNGVFVSEIPSLDQTMDNIVTNNQDDIDDITIQNDIINFNKPIIIPETKKIEQQEIVSSTPGVCKKKKSFGFNFGL